VLTELTTFNKSEMPDIMHGMVGACNGKWLLSWQGETSFFRKNGIKYHLFAKIVFTPNAKMPAETILQFVAALLIGSNGQSNCSGGARIGGSSDSLPEFFF
jgi:hypothetical protein